MNQLAKILNMGGEDFARHAAALVAVELRGDYRDDAPIWDSERRALVGFSPNFGTVQTFGTEEEAQRRASSALDAALVKLTSAGYALLCAPKTIDDEHHNWRRICRVRSPQGKRIALIAYTPWIEAWAY